MKPLILALLAVSAAAAPRTAALPLASHTLQGEVIAVELAHQRFTVKTAQTPAGLSLSWGPGTQFFRDDKLVASASLKPGQSITARYRVPFVGPRVAGRVFILSGAR